MDVQSENSTPSSIDVSFIDGEYLVFDLEAIKSLRNDHHISGILIGTLPQVPQQSVFLGLPLQLMPEEAALLVQKGIGRIIDEEASHGLLMSTDDDYDDSRRAQERIAEIEKPAGESRDGLLVYSTPAVSGLTDKVVRSESAVSSIYDTPRFHVYKYLHGKGFFLSPGLRFGSQFLGYPGDPLRYHSHYLVSGFAFDEEFPLIDLIGSGRLGTGVKKAWMVGACVPTGSRRRVNNAGEIEMVIKDEAEEDFASFCIEWAGFG
ncbi:uncharacterized protein V2V93DRAFT_12621 [Kockiozyma suomiensis]|uniref:uncharacterized protein n=1 Tax=Kockiozyma suomiensis TaxID=1337062 RepID=UPI003343F2BA